VNFPTAGAPPARGLHTEARLAATRVKPAFTGILGLGIRLPTKAFSASFPLQLSPCRPRR
jgi:hypothetical protein